MPAKKKILIVDDSATALMMEQIMLGQAYETVTAKDGAEGLKTAVRELPDLILLDVVMPKMDGFEVCRVLRGIDATRNIPIIMVTTRGEGKNVEAGFASGANDYVTKPINHRELLSKIQRHLGLEARVDPSANRAPSEAPSAPPSPNPSREPGSDKA